VDRMKVLTGWSEPRDLFADSHIQYILLILSKFLLSVGIRGKELGQGEQDDLQTYDVSTYSGAATLTSIGLTRSVRTPVALLARSAVCTNQRQGFKIAAPLRKSFP